MEKPARDRQKTLPVGHSRVDAVDCIALGEIRSRDACACGVDSVEELTDMLRKESPRSLNRRSKVYRVQFHRVDESPETRPKLSIQEVGARLERMDRRGDSGPWPHRVLKLIEKEPGVAASRLAEELGRAKALFKADVRKLEKLGLTKSLEVGYELTKVGRAVLRL